MRKSISLKPAVRCIGVAGDSGLTRTEGESCPERLRKAGLIARIEHNGLHARWQGTLVPERDGMAGLLDRLADGAEAAVAACQHLLVVGEAHSMAAATWRGIGRAAGQAPGVVWIDARLDADAPPGQPRAMSLAALFDEGVLNPERTVVIGARSYQETEFAGLAALGVRVFTMAEVKGRGLAQVFAEARPIIGRGLWGISLDLAAVDLESAPGVEIAPGGGLDPKELLAVLHGALRDRNCVAVEIAEHDPAGGDERRGAGFVIELVDAMCAPDSATLRRWEEGFGARNYAPLPVVLHEGKGCWVKDVEGRRYLDMMSAYSATSFGHGHPRLLAALTEQAGRLAVTSRAYFNDRLPLFLRRLAMLTGYDRVLPVNTGLEAVETALKAARKWAHKLKGVPDGKAEIIACNGNFHGRSISIVGLSSEAQYRDGFGPFPPGLKRIPYGDAAALEAAITPHTAAFLVEPIQGEGGIIVPPDGYLAACAAICKRHHVLLIADEVQTGLGRTGRLLACQHDGIRPDGVILGKALGGGLLPVSAFLADDAVMRVFEPGDHGSTFGGNPLACNVALTALDVLEEEELIVNSERLGELLLARLHQLAKRSPIVRAVRGRGLFAGMELDPERADAHQLAELLLSYGVLTKDTHSTVLRFAPPLVIGKEELEWGMERLAEALNIYSSRPRLAA